MRREVRLVTADLDAPPADTADGWLRLHLLSHRLVAPQHDQPRRALRRAHQRRVDLAGPVRRRRASSRPGCGCCARGTVQVFGVDKFPRMTDYVVPSGVRIADADRVRLGAHLASGTTVMHEGFVNFNAGTLGTSMVEGRISRRRRRRRLRHRRRRVDHGHPVRRRHGARQHRRALPARRRVRARHRARRRLRRRGRALRHGRHEGDPARRPTVVKARELSGQSNLLFRRNSVTGAVEAVPRDGARHRAQRRPARQRLTRRHRGVAPRRRTKDIDHMPRTARGAITLAEEQPRSPAAPPGGGAGRRRARRRGTAAVLGVRHLRAWCPASSASSRHPARLLVGTRPGEQRGGDHRRSPCSAGCRRGPRRSPSRRRCRSRRCATSKFGDRDSLGLFQQRPSQGWGTAEQILDPEYSTNKFYDALEKVKGYASMDIAQAAQKVQRSGGRRGLRRARGAGPGDGVGAVGPDPRRNGAARLEDRRRPATRARSRALVEKDFGISANARARTRSP